MSGAIHAAEYTGVQSLGPRLATMPVTSQISP